MSRLVEVGEMDKAVVREDVYRLLACPVPELRQAASELVAVLLLDAAEQHAKVKILSSEGLGRGIFERSRRGASRII